MKVEQEKLSNEMKDQPEKSSFFTFISKKFASRKIRILTLVCVSNLLIFIALAIIFIHYSLSSKKSEISVLKSDQKCVQLYVENLNYDEIKLENFKNKNCISQSAYEPQLLSYDTSISNQNFIKQVIACNNALVLLKCLKGQTISLISAYYGLQTSNSRTECLNISSSFSLNCYNIDSFEKIEKLCNEKNSCLVSASTRFFGDPCSGLEKQMVIQYQCKESNKTLIEDQQCKNNKILKPICPLVNNSSEIQQKIWCEPSNMIIECPKNKLIKVMCGFYGIDANYECPGTFKSGSEPSYCYSQNSTRKIMNSCDGKQKCVLRGDPNFVIGSNFENVCAGYAKILFVQWQCQDELTELLIKEVEKSEKVNFCQFEKNVKCPKSSPFYSESIDNIYDLEYPIYEQIACQNSKIVLSCPKELNIFIYSVYYGKQSPTFSQSCNLDRDINEENSSHECYSLNTYEAIRDMCQNKTSCLVNTNNLPDVCSSQSKQFYVQYQCMPERDLELKDSRCHRDLNLYQNLTFLCSNSDNMLKENFVINNTRVNITCENDKKIQIVCAYYGSHPIFNNFNNNICYSHRTTEILQILCNSRTSCEIENFQIFKNYCSIENIVFYYQFKCN
ncbi:unnamed protein product [Brachionus calyciflorus]|uniref:SUEL-type lectin domain-containing protein n=1 Tax=Brachionus calyciflorus TaxID=104777 RepID=A0A814AW33_9BILA|nr:unnamed protein product [Brachionus calyciflorus]